MLYFHHNCQFHVVIRCTGMNAALAICPQKESTQAVHKSLIRQTQSMHPNHHTVTKECCDLMPHCYIGRLKLALASQTLCMI